MVANFQWNQPRSFPTRFSTLSALAALCLFLPQPAFSAGEVLTHGPVVGGVTSSDARVFVRTNAAATVSLRYGTDPNLSTYSTSNSVLTAAANDFTGTISLSGLAAEKPYYLNVLVNGVSQFSTPYPTFNTFPSNASARDFKFLVLTDFTTVTSLSESVQTFDTATTEHPAFVFIGGDFDHRGPLTLTEKREMFRDLYDPQTPFMSNFVPDILRQYPIIHQWDDHDAGYNNVDRTYPDWNLSQQVFKEYVPTYPLPTVGYGIWQKFSYAQVECFVLDNRSQRDPEADADNASKSMLDGNNLGSAGQLQWLKDGLLGSTARWKVIFTSVIVNNTTKFPDGWAGYQTEWQALRSFIESNHIENVVFISGDLHIAAIDNGSISGFPEMCVGVPNSRAGKSGCGTGPPGQWSEGYDNRSCAGYGRITVLQNPDRMVLEGVDQFGASQVSYTVNAGGVVGSGPTITTQPKDASVRAGRRARFSVQATGAAPLAYQWKKNGVDIAGATRATYKTPPVTSADNGSVFAVAVSNSGGSVTSNNATLTVR